MNSRASRITFLHYSDAPDGVEREYEVTCDVTPGARATWDDPGCGPEVDVLQIMLDGREVAPNRLDHAAIAARALEIAAEQAEAAYNDEQDRKYDRRAGK